MPRLNFEERWFIDPRRSLLISKLGNEYTADGLMLAAWRTAQYYWSKTHNGIPLPAFEKIPNSDLIIQCGLAEIRGEFAYVKGSKECFSWLVECSEAGKRSAAQRTRNHSGKNPTSSNLLQPLATSSSSSSSKKKNTYTSKPDNLDNRLTPQEASASVPAPDEQEPNLGEDPPPLGDGPPPEILLAEIWNAHRGTLPRVLALSPNRIRSAKARWRDNPDAEYWVMIVKKLAASDFCCGRIPKNTWVATFDFLLKPDSHLKVIEGQFDNKNKNNTYKAGDYV